MQKVTIKIVAIPQTTANQTKVEGKKRAYAMDFKDLTEKEAQIIHNLVDALDDLLQIEPIARIVVEKEEADYKTA